ncbi:hypothetical protein BDM02DRAFT_3112731 [Thelephora ganbajun]|uniref:Uncharacterized protein n=1 Tax=Thelephora ganbajun TaxID=370292 RepID=A0ACB6ZLE0_THEGA|nr:hypothetical protein BDM02DRAFT_3112731 [Thelephora ganbajun]
MASPSTQSPDQPQYSTYTNVWQPNQRAPTTQYIARKAQPIKPIDSEPAPDRPDIYFCDLYVNASYNSPKCSKVLIARARLQRFPLESAIPPLP